MKQFYIKRYVCGVPQYWNILTGQWMSRMDDECFIGAKEEALYHAAAQAFPGAVVYEADRVTSMDR